MNVTQLHNRTVTGFVHEHVEEIDELGFVRSHPKKKSVTKQTKQRRTNIQKKQYRFKRAIINTPGYLKYFDPSIEGENRLLGIGEMASYVEQISTGKAESLSGCEIPQLRFDYQCGRHTRVNQTNAPSSLRWYSDPRGGYAGSPKSDHCHAFEQTLCFP